MYTIQRDSASLFSGSYYYAYINQLKAQSHIDSTQLNSWVELGLCQFWYVTVG